MDYESVEAINKHFGKLIKDTDSDDEKRSFALEQREAVADYRESSAARRELDAHRATVLAKSGIPDDFHEFVTGTTPEEIDASAAKIAERVTKLTSEANDKVAAAAYGTAGAAGGSAAGAQEPKEIEDLKDFEIRFNQAIPGQSATRTGNDGKISVREAEQYVNKLGAARIVDHLARNSANSNMRALAQRVDLQTLREKST